MTLPSGLISLGDVATEFGGSNPHGLGEYYFGGTYDPAGTAGIPASGLISLGDFHSKTKNVSTPVTSIVTPASDYQTVQSHRKVIATTSYTNRPTSFYAYSSHGVTATYDLSYGNVEWPVWVDFTATQSETIHANAANVFGTGAYADRIWTVTQIPIGSLGFNWIVSGNTGAGNPTTVSVEVTYPLIDIDMDAYPFYWDYWTGPAYGAWIQMAAVTYNAGVGTHDIQLYYTAAATTQVQLYMYIYPHGAAPAPSPWASLGLVWL